MGEDAGLAEYQPTIHLSINWKPGETEPEVLVFADDARWRLWAVAKVLHRALDWYHAEESLSGAIADGLAEDRVELEYQNRDAESQVLYSVIHELIYAEPYDDDTAGLS